MMLVIGSLFLLGALAANADCTRAIIGVAFDGPDDANGIPTNWNNGFAIPDRLIDENGIVTDVRLRIANVKQVINQDPIASTVPIHTPDLSALNSFGESSAQGVVVRFEGLDEDVKYKVWVIQMSNTDFESEWAVVGDRNQGFEVRFTSSASDVNDPAPLVFNGTRGDDTETFESYATTPLLPAPGSLDVAGDGFIAILGVERQINADNVDFAGFAIQPVPNYAYVSQTEGCNGKTPCYTSIFDAQSGEDSGTVILITGEDYDVPVNSIANKRLTLCGGWNADYSAQNSITTVNSLKIDDSLSGSLFIDAVKVKEPSP